MYTIRAWVGVDLAASVFLDGFIPAKSSRGTIIDG